jgi:hypothetical protein
MIETRLDISWIVRNVAYMNFGTFDDVLVAVNQRGNPDLRRVYTEIIVPAIQQLRGGHNIGRTLDTENISSYDESNFLGM